MAIPLALALVPIALLLLSCNEESDSKNIKKEKIVPPEDDCAGTAHDLAFGPEQARLCHGDVQNDGVYQSRADRLTLRSGSSSFEAADSAALLKFSQKFGTPTFDGLHLRRWKQTRDWVFAGGDWSPTAEFMTGSLERQLQAELITPAEVMGLAGKTRSSGSSSRVVALAIAGALLSLKKEESEFARNHHEALDNIFEGIRRGTLRVLPEPSGQKTPQGLMIYRSDLDAVLAGSLEPFRDTFTDSWFRSGLLHELYHYHQDAQGLPKDHLAGEREAYLFQAKYLASRPKEELERILAGLRKIHAEHPIFGALKAVTAPSGSPEAAQGIAEADQAIQNIHLDLMFHLLVSNRGNFIRPSGAGSVEEALAQLESQRDLRLKEVRRIVKKPSFASGKPEDRTEVVTPLNEYLRLSVSIIGYRYAAYASRLPNPAKADRKELERLISEGQAQVKSELRGYPVFRGLAMRLDGVRVQP